MNARFGARAGLDLTSVWSGAAFWATCLLFVLAPVVRGGNRQVALIPLEWLGLVVLLMLLAQWLTQPGVSRLDHKLLLLIALGPFAVAPLQLLPLPPALWNLLAGHLEYAGALAAVKVSLNEFRPASLVPDATWAAMLAGIPVSAAFILAWTCRQGALRFALRLLVGVALVQALVGLMQLSAVNWLYFGAFTDGQNRAIGTFGNANHFANFLAMAMPVAFMAFRRADRSAGPEPEGSANLLWGVALFVLLAGVLASRSRAGIVTALTVTLLAVLIVPGRDTVQRLWRWRLAGMGALVLLAIASVGLDTITARFAGKASGELGTRLQIMASTWRAAMEFFPFGSGLGSFDAVYPRFQPDGVVGFVEYAHSDYLQLLMECGLLFVILGGLALWVWCRRTWHFARYALSEEGLEPHEVVQVICGVAALALLLHSWVDFNMHIPANAIVGAFLLGAYLRPIAQETDEAGVPAGRRLRLARSGS